MVRSVDVKLDPKDGLEYAAGTELHESRGSEVCPAAATGNLRIRWGGTFQEARAMILRAKWRQTASPAFSNSLRRCRL
jgi:hypothetical protein